MSFYEAKKYLAYRFKAGNEHGLHSPFVFKLYTEVIRNKERYYAYDALDRLRLGLLKNNSAIEVTDFGAGSKKLGKKRKIADIARISVVPQKYGELLFRLVNYFQPKHILELGTSLGLSSLYLHKAAPSAGLITVEGCPNTFAFAKKMIETDLDSEGQGKGNVAMINSSFENALEKEIKGKTFDFIYIDGNHTYEATVKYFQALLQHSTPQTVMIFDDIYWSEGMTRAWEEIKAHKQVTVTVDLFKFGLVFFRTENREKEDFILSY